MAVSETLTKEKLHSLPCAADPLSGFVLPFYNQM